MWLWAGRGRAPAPARVDDAMDVASYQPWAEQLGGWDHADMPDGKGDAIRRTSEDSC
jgi:hypothetical protein